MIAGELESLMMPYDTAHEEHFFGRKTQDAVEEGTGRGKAFFQKVGGVIGQFGGFENLGRTVDQLSGRPRSQPFPQQGPTPPPPPPPPAKPRIPTGIWIAGAVVALAGIGLLIYSLQPKST